jgi:uncharacterized phage protein (TIGR02218 family)
MALQTTQQNLKVSRQYLNWLMAANRAIMGNLYQFTSVTGINSYYTDLDVTVNALNINWTSGSLRFEGLQRKVGIGLNVDEQNLKIWAGPNDTMFGSQFLLGAAQGLLDGAQVVRYRAVWQFITGNAAVDVANNQPLAVWPLFTGYVSSIAEGGASHIELKVKSALVKLTTNMPRNYYQPGCNWTLFDQGCTLNKASYGVNGTVGPGGATAKLIPVNGGISPSVGSDGITQYRQGRILFTSGVNSGEQFLIDDNDAFTLVLAYALDNIPATGDTFTYYPGCSKSYNTCSVKFANTVNFRGFDKVPPIYVSV